MKPIILKTRIGTSSIHIDESVKNLFDYISTGRIVTITDQNVRKLYSGLFPPAEVIEIGIGEEGKTLKTVESIYKAFLNLELDRTSFVLGIGGGVVCDITGYCASTYMRGLKFGFVPTTLLAQVDAGIGGKNGVNFQGYKNIIGVISQPEFVLVDLSFLKTLPETEYNCGIAEIIKSALIKDEGLFRFLEDNLQKIESRESDSLQKAVAEAIAIKTDLVQRDPQDYKERRLLNFGHSIGHALEKSMNIPHGEAVSCGMVVAAIYSEKRGMLSKEAVSRIKGLLQKFHLPTLMPCAAGPILEAIKKDKKRQDKEIHLILLAGIGKAEMVIIPYKELESWIHDMYKHL